MHLKKLKILIADDEPVIRGLLTSYLARTCQHDIIKAKDGKEALEKFTLQARDIDICFLDIDMPKLDGLALLKAIREINPDAYVVMLSGVGTLVNVKAAIAAGVNGFIAKPFTHCKIAESLDNYHKRVTRCAA